jgi:serine/threonine protein kinase
MPGPDAQGPVNEEEIFQAAAELCGEERAAFLLSALGSQPGLRERVERLLASHDENSFMSQAAERTRMKAQGAPPKHLHPEEGGKRIGRYKLLQRIGEGGCGIVYMAQQQDPCAARCLKIIKLGMDTSRVSPASTAERQALAMMDHPNIAKVLDAGDHDTAAPTSSWNWCAAQITEYCDQNHLSTPNGSLFVQVCQAIQHAHQKGIIHRDIKPSNILVTLHDGVPVPK